MDNVERSLAQRIEHAKEEARGLLLMGHVAVFENNDEPYVTLDHLDKLEALENLVQLHKARKSVQSEKSKPAKRAGAS